MKENEINAILIKPDDNVATVFSNGKTNDIAKVSSFDGDRINIKISEDIPFGHKLAVKDIKKGEEIIKYGEEIGIASKNIKKGDYVHIHNLNSMRGRGDLKSKEGNS